MAFESTRSARDRNDYELPKVPTGIPGLDDVTGGGFPAGRPTLVCGSAGCGKTLLAMEFVVRGAVEFGEPGVFVAFEETEGELSANVRSLGFDLEGLVAAEKLVVEHVHVDRAELEENGEYDLDGLFIRLGHAIDARFDLDVALLAGDFRGPTCPGQERCADEIDLGRSASRPIVDGRRRSADDGHTIERR